MSTIQRVPAIQQWLLEDYNISGAEEGFNERADVIIAADGTDLNSFWNEVQETIRLRNLDRNRLIDALSFRVQGVTEEVQPPQEVDFEPASEFGQPQGIRTGATRLWRGYDFKFYDLAIRYTWMFLAEADQAQLRQLNNLALEADTKLIYQRVMKTIFNPLNLTGFTDKNEPVTVYKFYNGDAEVPPTYNYTTFSTAHNHYTISGNTAVTSANVDALSLQLTEHGYDLNSGYRMVLWVNKVEADIIRTFRTATGAKFDFVANPAYYGGAVWVPNNGQYVGAPAGTLENEIGTYGSFHVVQEGLIPAGYLVAIATGGQNNISNPVGLREHTNPAYRGLKVIPGQRSDYPLVDSFYRRGIGSGIRHRGAGAVMQVKASGSYAVPTQFV
jgi:hypothetical protein